MKFLFRSADEYLRQSDWRDLALIKICLFAIGVMAGIALPSKAKKPAVIAAASVFTATYIPLMTKYIKIAAGMLQCPGETEPED